MLCGIILVLMTRAEFQSSVEDILGLSPGSLKDSDSRDTVRSWSSLEDVNILAMIRADLGIDADAELLQVETFGEIVGLLREKAALAD